MDVSQNVALAVKYLNRKKISGGSVSTLRKVQKARRIAAGVRPDRYRLTRGKVTLTLGQHGWE